MQREYQDLIHTLNSRYQAEFDRAERLAAELRHIQSSRLWRLCCLLRGIVRPGRRANIAVANRPEFKTVMLTPGMLPTGRVSIIVPFRDQFELLGNCLRSLQQTRHDDYEVILIDNGSANPLPLADFPRPLKLLHCAETFNFSRLCNLGAAAATGDFLLFLNNDTEILAPDWLSHMLRLLASPDVGIVGATLLYPDRTLQHAGIFPQTNGAWQHRYRGQPADYAGEFGELHKPRSVPAVTGACLLIRKQLFKELGRFDEALPVTMNDVELCQRARGRGHHVAISPDARLLHFESLSRGYSFNTHAVQTTPSGPAATDLRDLAAGA